METYFAYTDKKQAFFSSDERRWINKIMRLKEQYPDQVEILAEAATNDGCLYCKLPVEWLKIAPKRRVNMSDEQRSANAERLAKLRSKSATQLANGGQ